MSDEFVVAIESVAANTVEREIRMTSMKHINDEMLLGQDDQQILREGRLVGEYGYTPIVRMFVDDVDVDDDDEIDVMIRSLS